MIAKTRFESWIDTRTNDIISQSREIVEINTTNTAKAVSWILSSDISNGMLNTEEGLLLCEKTLKEGFSPDEALFAVFLIQLFIESSDEIIGRAEERNLIMSKIVDAPKKHSGTKLKKILFTLLTFRLFYDIVDLKNEGHIVLLSGIPTIVKTYISASEIVQEKIKA